MKICVDCKLEKPLDEYPSTGSKNKQGQPYRRGRCKKCYNRFQLAYRGVPENAERIKKSWNNASRKYQTQDHVQGRRRLRKYGMSQEDFDLLYAKQEGQCAICLKAIELVIDHCHESLRVRGLLCNGCNLMIGYAKDDPAILQSAIKYLHAGGGVGNPI